MARREILCLAACVVLACVCPVLAQQSIDSASITGRVEDPSGAAVPGARVLVQRADRNQNWEARSDEGGRFDLLFVPPGPYAVSVTASGFARYDLPITLTVGQVRDIRIPLSLEGVSAAVQVTADAPLVETRRTQASDTILPAEVDALPLNGRNYLDLALLVPGVSRTVQRNTERFAETSAVPGTGLSVSGQRNLNNTFIVDGLSANDDAAGLAGTYFAQDVIREFQVVTSGGIAEFGRASSGIVNIVTQSGANARHGRVYGYFRDDALDARNPLATTEDPLSQEQFGLSFSGPIVRDRTFWFANAERTNLDKTGIVTIAPGVVEVVNDTLDGIGYRGGQLTTGACPTGYRTTNAFARADDSFGASSRVTARYSLYDVGSENARNVGGLNAVSRGTRLDNRDQTGAVSWLASVSATSFNELRAQATRSRLGAPPNDLVGPAINIAGVASFGTATFSPTRRDLDVFELSDSFTISRGSHLMKAGAQLLHERLDIEFPGALQGVFTFPSLAAFRAGAYSNYQQAFGEPRQFQSNTNVGVFIQDEWRPRPAITLNLGLRYDVQGLAEPVRSDLDNVSPRVGVAFAPGDGRTVLRASGGLYFDRIPLRALSNALQRDGVKYRVAVLAPGQAGAPVFPNVLSDVPAELLTSITSMDPGIDNGVSRQFGLQIERQLARGVSATIGYAHLAGRQIIMSRNVNVPTLSAAAASAQGVPNLGRPDPTVANNSQYQSIGQSDYDGLTLSLKAARRRLGTVRVSYTLSKALDDAGNAFFTSPQNNLDVHDDYGRSDNDQRHRLVVSGVMPSIWGMELAYVASYASAPPFTLQANADLNHDTNVNDRPIGVGRNTGEGFDYASVDVRISRRFAVAGAHQLEVSVDAFNVLNRSNFLIPNNAFGTGAVPPASFGRPTAAGDPRQWQLGVRWSF